MSENTNEPVTNTDITGIAAEAADQTESAPETANEEKTRPSVVLALSGLVAVLVGGWALTGEDFVALIHSDLLGWLAIAIAIAIGVALVAVPTRRGRS
ncbi:hypothetical protein [Mycobacteroides abscessus]|uniref:Transmembrane protein n=1 Tax=Mycobacteroides abscessus MAB_030201_1075 TaxID=1335410 RepID=A0A829PUC6_9MYCO|nr:hypothetical protein [Mycobacteroides abscessus]ETZ90819.1 hypothetical protein L829_4405 [Mycobacteroides abscessus MAB_030201_1075]ETZ93570.1 hypothetical protein L828_1522 [Mycobacteroides abscessus MAB_030201_1061]AMU71694.1 hypothetical protein A3O05_17810 [Mycobacteroides abscessus]ETZ74393.1 hypothetical protein L835_1476 [Mycobacteroides abscessus MAB_110811_1470]MDM2015569.1 hypothetical protein [Mycobacteroides abscessus]